MLLTTTAKLDQGTTRAGALARALASIQRPPHQIETCEGHRPPPSSARATVPALGLTAQRVLAARAEAKQLDEELRQLITVVGAGVADPAS